MPRYKLRTLLILLAIGPIALAAQWFFLFDVFRPLPSVAVAVYLTVTIAIIFAAGLAGIAAVGRLASRLMRRR